MGFALPGVWCLSFGACGDFNGSLPVDSPVPVPYGLGGNFIGRVFSPGNLNVVPLGVVGECDDAGGDDADVVSTNGVVLEELRPEAVAEPATAERVLEPRADPLDEDNGGSAGGGKGGKSVVSIRYGVSNRRDGYGS